MPNMPPALDAPSPMVGFVEVCTPSDHRAVPSTDELDVNGLRLGSWSTELSDRDRKAPYFWFVSLCPCVPIAQLEKRLGVASYASALLRHGVPYVVLVALFVAIIDVLFRRVVHGEGLVLELALIVLFHLMGLAMMWPVIKLRTMVRERFSITGSIKDDQCQTLKHPSAVIRQLGKHLQCDRVTLLAPTTLQTDQV